MESVSQIHLDLAAAVQLLLRLGNSRDALVRRRPAERDGREDTEKSRGPAGGSRDLAAGLQHCLLSRGRLDWTGGEKSDEKPGNAGGSEGSFTFQLFKLRR